MRSVVVVLPASMCAMMPQLRTTLEMPRLATAACAPPAPRRQVARTDARSIGRAGLDEVWPAQRSACSAARRGRPQLVDSPAWTALRA